MRAFRIFLIGLICALACTRLSIDGGPAIISLNGNPNSLDFPKTSVEFTSSMTLTFVNTGETDARDFHITTPTAPFAFLGGTYPGTDGTCGTQISGFGGRCTVTLEFAPLVGGNQNSLANVTYDNGPGTEVVALDLLGQAVAQGILDDQFGNLGKAQVPGGANETIKSLLLQTDGKIIFVGGTDGGAGGGDILMGRLLSNGTLDGSYGTGGLVTLDSGMATNDIVNNAIYQSDDKIVIVGAQDTSAVLYRVFANGTFDTSFGLLNGVSVLTHLSLLSTDQFFKVLRQSDGKYIAIGETDPLVGNPDMVAVRTTALGLIDAVGMPIFGTAGAKQVDFAAAVDRALSGFLQTDGKIILVGYTGAVGAGRNSALARLTTAGAMDAAFGAGTGKISTDICGAANSDEINDVTVTSGGKIILVGYCTRAGTGKDIFVAQRNADGTSDLTFNAGTGIRMIDVAGAEDVGTTVALQDNNQIVIGGFSDTGPDTDFVLVRLESNGSFDTSFGVNGIVTVDVENNDENHALVLQSDRKILSGGFSTGSDKDCAVIRNFP